MASFLHREDLCEVPRVLSVATILRSSEASYSTPIQSHVCHSMPDPDLAASTATTIPSSSVYSTSYTQTYNSADVDYFDSKDFWSEFDFPGLARNQRGVDEINQEVEDDQMGRPVLMVSRKRHKGVLGGVTEYDPTV